MKLSDILNTQFDDLSDDEQYNDASCHEQNEHKELSSNASKITQVKNKLHILPI